jgi:ribose transport system ATP-binding protein
MSSLENMLMPHFGRLGRGRLVRLRRRRRESRVFAQMGEVVGLLPPDPAMAIDGFSGGNAQKIAVARWTCGMGAARLLLMDEPTQGVDVGARRDLYDLITEWCEKAQAAVLFATSDPEEVLALADRVVILAEGRVVHAGPADLSEPELIALAQPRAGEEGIAS